MGKRGPKSTYRPDFHPDNFIQLSEQGKVLIQIARTWKVSRETVYEWRRKYTEMADAIKKGRQLSEAWYMDLGQLALVDQATVDGKKIKVHLGFYVWMTKNLFGWRDKTETNVEHAGEINAQVNRGEELKKIFKTEECYNLAVQLAERLASESNETKNGLN